MDEIYYIESSQLDTFFNLLKKKYKVFAPAIKDPRAQKLDYYYQILKQDTRLVYNAYRTVEPLKAFFTQPYEKLTDYFTPEKNITDIIEKTIVFGVKSCDIAGHRVQDFVFLEGAEVDTSTSSLDYARDDPERAKRVEGSLSVNGERSRTIDSLYRLRRENTVFISGDCTDFKEVCHCLAWEILPYPTEGFDLNLFPLNDGYLVEIGTKEGEDLIQKHKEYFLPAKETQIAARKVKRENLIDRLKRHLLPQNLVSKDSVQKLVRQGYNLDTWKELMLTCVECGGCNLICDTCHCFLLADKKEGHLNQKLRVWDSCLYANYARVAGGANPLNTRAKRLRNRFMKKFDFFVDNLGVPACCGCGRCIEVCPGKIDIREVLKDLAKKVASRE